MKLRTKVPLTVGTCLSFVKKLILMFVKIEKRTRLAGVVLHETGEAGACQGLCPCCSDLMLIHLFLSHRSPTTSIF